MKTLKKVLLVLVFFILMILFNQSSASAVTVKQFLDNPTAFSGEQLNGDKLYINGYQEEGNWYNHYVCVHAYATGWGDLEIRSVIDVTTNKDVTVYGSSRTRIVKDSADKETFYKLAKLCYARMSSDSYDGDVATFYHDHMSTFSKYGVAHVGSRPSYAYGGVDVPGSLPQDIRILVTQFTGGAGRTR